MIIKEIFEDIEGEGKNQGLPTIFIRLAGCNLRCSYCDTKYAYKGGYKITAQRAAEIINKRPQKYVNITGGEPLLQKKEVKELIKRIKNKFVSIETNGTMPVFGTGADMISMDIKLPSSGEAGKTLRSNLGKLRKKDQIKFVIGSAADLKFGKRFLEKNKVKATVAAQPVYKKFSVTKIRNYVLKNGLNWRAGIQLHKLK